MNNTCGAYKRVFEFVGEQSFNQSTYSTYKLTCDGLLLKPDGSLAGGTKEWYGIIAEIYLDGYKCIAYHALIYSRG